MPNLKDVRDMVLLGHVYLWWMITNVLGHKGCVYPWKPKLKFFLIQITLSKNNENIYLHDILL